jgi:hypothetical protein
MILCVPTALMVGMARCAVRAAFSGATDGTVLK